MRPNTTPGVAFLVGFLLSVAVCSCAEEAVTPLQPTNDAGRDGANGYPGADSASATLDAFETVACEAFTSSLACLDRFSCDWFTEGCRDRTGADPPMLRFQYKGMVTLGDLFQGDEVWLSVRRKDEGTYLGLLAMKAPSISLVFPTEVQVSPAGGVVLETAAVDCTGDASACAPIAAVRFAGRIVDDAIVLDTYEGLADDVVDLRLAPHDGVKPLPHTLEPVDPDPVAGRYAGSVWARQPGGFTEDSSCAFVISGTGDAGYTLSESACVFGEVVDDSFRHDLESRRFWFQFDAGAHRVTMIGERHVDPSNTLYRLEGVAVRDDGSFWRDAPPVDDAEIPIEDVLGAFVLPEEHR